MATVLETAPTRKARAYYAHLYDEAGALCKVGEVLYFVGGGGAIVAIEPSMINWLTVLGEMTIADRQRLTDLMNGDAVGIACNRAMGVQ